MKEQGNQIRRRFPRRNWRRNVGVLYKGSYFISISLELGEGGMSILSKDFVLERDQHVVVTFQIPYGEMVCFLAEIKSIRKENGDMVHGLAFKEVTFSHRRQIRTFVSERVEEYNAIY